MVALLLAAEADGRVCNGAHLGSQRRHPSLAASRGERVDGEHAAVVQRAEQLAQHRRMPQRGRWCAHVIVAAVRGVVAVARRRRVEEYHVKGGATAPSPSHVLGGADGVQPDAQTRTQPKVALAEVERTLVGLDALADARRVTLAHVHDERAAAHAEEERSSQRPLAQAEGSNHRDVVLR